MPGNDAARLQPVYIAVAPAQNEGVDLVDLWGPVLRHKWLIVAVTAGFAIAGIAYALVATPIYRSDVVLMPVTADKAGSALSRLGGLASMAGISLDVGGDSVRSVAMLRSRKFVEDFIRDKNLLPLLFSEEWDDAKKDWRTDVVEERPDIRDGTKLFSEDVRFIAQDRETGLLTLSVEWTDPETAAAWARELVDRINESARRADVEEAERKLTYLSEQLESANLSEARQAIARVMEEQVNALMLAKGQVDYAFKVIDPATVPKEQARPNRPLVVVMATLLGGLVGWVIALVRAGSERRAGQPSRDSGRRPTSGAPGGNFPPDR